jgi:hypothetical protein
VRDADFSLALPDRPTGNQTWAFTNYDSQGEPVYVTTTYTTQDATTTTSTYNAYNTSELDWAPGAKPPMASGVNAKAAPVLAALTIRPPAGQPLQLWTGYVADKVSRNYYQERQGEVGNLAVFTNMRLSTLTFGGNPSWSRPDIVDFGNAPAFVYEIKPQGSELVAHKEALGYVAALAQGGVNADLGPIDRVGTSGIRELNYATIYFSSQSPGTITYRWVWSEQYAAGLAIAVALGSLASLVSRSLAPVGVP